MTTQRSSRGGGGGRGTGGGGRGTGGGGRGGGRGMGGGSGRGQGAARMGSGGFCVCPKCGHKQEHQPGVPCLDERCSECGTAMVREGSPHHREIEERKSGDDR